MSSQAEILRPDSGRPHDRGRSKPGRSLATNSSSTSLPRRDHQRATGEIGRRTPRRGRGRRRARDRRVGRRRRRGSTASRRPRRSGAGVPRVRARRRVERGGGVRRACTDRGNRWLDHGRRRGGRRGRRPLRRGGRLERRRGSHDTRVGRARARASPCWSRSACTSRSDCRDGALEHPTAARRRDRGIRRRAVPLAASIYSQRPEVPLAPLAVASGVAAVIGLVGYVRRCRSAGTAQERARLQWVAWGVVVAAAISVGASRAQRR